MPHQFIRKILVALHALIIIAAEGSRTLSSSNSGGGGMMLPLPCKDDTAWGEIRNENDNENAPRVAIRSSDATATDSASIITEEIDIAIVGGGLVGLTLAIGLTRLGINCKVYERAPQLRSVSQGILSIKPIGMRALEEIHPDIPTKVMNIGCERHRRVLTKIDADGKEHETVDDNMGKDDLAKYGRRCIGITWHNMQKVLASMLPPDVVETNHALSSFVEEGDGDSDGGNSVLLHFQGGEIVKCQAALMCDGVFSVARRQMFPDDRVIYFGQLNWGSVVPTDTLPPSMHPPNAVRFCTYSGEPKWTAMLNDGGGGYTFFQLRVTDSEKALSLSGSKGRGGLGLPGALERLMPIVQPCKDVASALANIPEERIFERCIVGRLPASTWLSSGKRVALVGDSAHGMHPNISQGANTGFEAARILIQALKGSKGDWKAGFEAYEETHKPRADLIQSFANLMGCVQSQQKDLIPKAVIDQMLEWINTADETKLPSKDELDNIMSFDPLGQDGVSLI